MSDDFYIDYYDHGNTEFIVDDSMTNQVRVRIDYYPIVNDVRLVEDNHEVYLDFKVVESLNIKDITDSIIRDLKHNKLHTYDQLGRVSMTITTSQDNINKMQDNYDKHYYSDWDYEDEDEGE